MPLNWLRRSRLRIKNKIYDYSNLESWPMVQQKEVDSWYKKLIKKIRTLSDIFKEKEIFEEVVDAAEKENKPKIVLKEPRYSSIFNFREAQKDLEHLIHPSHPKKSKFWYVPDYNPRKKRIRLPCDRNPAEMRESLCHETLHHILIGYLMKLKQNLIADEIKEEDLISAVDAEYYAHEVIVENLTDLCLEDDPEARFERHWSRYEMRTQIRSTSMLPYSLLTGVLLAAGVIYNPLFWLGIPISYFVTKLAYKKHKQKKKEEILAYKLPEFKKKI